MLKHLVLLLHGCLELKRYEYGATTANGVPGCGVRIQYIPVLARLAFGSPLSADIVSVSVCAGFFCAVLAVALFNKWLLQIVENHVFPRLVCW